MRRASLVLFALVLGVSGCGLWPTGDDIDESLDQQLRSVAGPWTGTSTPLTLDFQLTQGSGTTVTGSGTMKEAAAAGSVPITLSGTFQRPDLSLTISGMVFEGKAMTGTIQGSYTTVAGISAPLVMTGGGSTREVTILLQEK
ncbi:MAG TPA: hypothetical protein VJT67_01440 [Longimicrobiaceae bacterium]|nr:hypothetical protein [Longimicrobiaceae bacterium]